MLEGEVAVAGDRRCESRADRACSMAAHGLGGVPGRRAASRPLVRSRHGGAPRPRGTPSASTAGERARVQRPHRAHDRGQHLVASASLGGRGVRPGGEPGHEAAELRERTRPPAGRPRPRRPLARSRPRPSRSDAGPRRPWLRRAEARRARRRPRPGSDVRRRPVDIGRDADVAPAPASTARIAASSRGSPRALHASTVRAVADRVNERPGWPQRRRFLLALPIEGTDRGYKLRAVPSPRLSRPAPTGQHRHDARYGGRKEGIARGNRNREVVQLREGLRLHHA